MSLPTQSVFIAGTDTGVGKTHVSVQLLRRLAELGFDVTGMKPVAAGAVRTAAGLRNDDAVDLAAAANVSFPYELINPVCFELATSPHLAARAAHASIDLNLIAASFRELARRADIVVVEGAGGWLAPIDDRRTMEDVAVTLGLPVVLVVGIRLGSLSHALLTTQAIERSGLPFAGWVANRLDPSFASSDDYVRTLEQRLGAPRLDLTS